MSILPLIPIVILLGGSLAVALSRGFGSRYASLITAVVALAALLALLPLHGTQLVETMVSSWRPLSVFGAPVSLRVDRAGWLIGIVAALMCVSTSLSQVAYPDRRRPGLCAAGLGMSALLIAASFAANFLTQVLAWGLFDAFYAASLLLRTGTARGDAHSTVGRGTFLVALNGAATLGVGIAALTLNQAHQSQYWHLVDLPDTTRALLTVSAALRLGVYPLNQWLSVKRSDVSHDVPLLIVLPALAGFQLLIRLAGLNAIAYADTLAWLGVLSMLAGGVLAWWRGHAIQPSQAVLPYLALGSLGTVIVAACLSDTADRVFISGAAGWALALTTLSIGRSLDARSPWWSIGHALALATLVGLPGTLGFAVRANLAAGVAGSGNGLMIALSVIGETLTFGAMFRMTLTPPVDDAPGSRAARIVYALSIALVSLAPFLLPALGRAALPELIPPAFETVLANLGLVGGLLLPLPLVLAVALVWRAPAWHSALRFDPGRFISLEWIYTVGYWLINALARALRGLAIMIEGEGALLWALLLLVAVYVVSGGAIQ